MPAKRKLALYDYDPVELSPNVDAEVELSFRAGDIVLVCKFFAFLFQLFLEIVTILMKIKDPIIYFFDGRSSPSRLKQFLHLAGALMEQI